MPNEAQATSALLETTVATLVAGACSAREAAARLSASLAASHVWVDERAGGRFEIVIQPDITQPVTNITCAR